MFFLSTHHRQLEQVVLGCSLFFIARSLQARLGLMATLSVVPKHSGTKGLMPISGYVGPNRRTEGNALGQSKLSFFSISRKLHATEIMFIYFTRVPILTRTSTSWIKLQAARVIDARAACHI